jgi:quinol monooxygenase YgiN
MAKVHVIARFVANEGKENQLRALLQGMLIPTRAEKGCESYELYESDTKGRFYLNETWESQAALDRHMATPHFERLKKTGSELVKGPFEINLVKGILPPPQQHKFMGPTRRTTS